MSNRTKPLVSVVIPVYNRAHMITQSVESVMEQDFDNYEIIISDDGSTDNLMEVLSQYGDRICVVRGPNGGCGTARTRAIEAARGEFIANHDSDDRMLPGRLAAQAKFLEEHPEVAAITGNVIFEGDEQIDYLKSRGIDFSGNSWVVFDHPFAKILSRNFMADAASMFRRVFFLEIGGYDLSLRRSADWNLWLRMARKWPLACMSKPYTWVGKHEGNRNVSSVEIICNLRIIVHGLNFKEPLDNAARKTVYNRLAQETRSYLRRYFTESPQPEGKIYFLQAVKYLPWYYRLLISLGIGLPQEIIGPLLDRAIQIRNRLRNKHN